MKKGGKLSPAEQVKQFKAQLPKAPKRHKFNAIKTEVDGIVFHSKKEAKRYGELKILEQQRMIEELVLQPEYPLKVNGYVVCKYVADFRYYDRMGRGLVVEDVKSPITRKQPDYRIKVKLMLACYGITVSEV